jgi:ACS family hexuronate transporter-like MFS transporter
MAGVAVAVVADLVLGAVLDTANNSGYFWAFVIAGLSYISILGFVHLLMPDMTPMDDNLEYVRRSD